MRFPRSRRALLGLVACTVLLAACGPDVWATYPPPPDRDARLKQMVDGANFERWYAGAPALSLDLGHVSKAQYAANRMMFTSNGRCAASHSAELPAWYGGLWYGENVACVQGWGACPPTQWETQLLFLASPSHKATMINPFYRRIGVGVACNGTMLWTAVHFTS